MRIELSEEENNFLNKYDILKMNFMSLMMNLRNDKERRNDMFDHLFQPININGMILKNRIIATPTGDDFEEKAMEVQPW